MGKSRRIIEKLLESLESAITENQVVYEAYRELPEDLEPRQDIRKFRIALYNRNEDNVIKVGAEKPADSRQQYGIDISVVRAYRGDRAKYHELDAIDVKDEILDWIKDLDAFTVSGGAISSFGYDGATEFTRRKRFATITLLCSGQKDLIAPQGE